MLIYYKIRTMKTFVNNIQCQYLQSCILFLIASVMINSSNINTVDASISIVKSSNLLYDYHSSNQYKNSIPSRRKRIPFAIIDNTIVEAPELLSIRRSIYNVRGGDSNSNNNNADASRENDSQQETEKFLEEDDEEEFINELQQQQQQQQQQQSNFPPYFQNQQQQPHPQQQQQQQQQQQYQGYDPRHQNLNNNNNNNNINSINPYHPSRTSQSVDNNQFHSEYPQQQQQQQQQMNPPQFSEGPNGNNWNHDQMLSPQNQNQIQQQQQQIQRNQPNQPNRGYQNPPPLPGDENDNYQRYNDPVEDTKNSKENVWDPTAVESSNNDNNADLALFNKEFIQNGLAKLYRKKILPIEMASRYGQFQSPPLSPSDFHAPPMILLLGQYSVGKTSFVKYLLGRDFPGSRVGPEPTTDRFNAILWGPHDKVIPGAALCSQMDRPFTGLNPFGNNFLSRIEAIEINSPILQNITIIDTPGILSGQKQKSRNYDYEAVMKWFAERADLIIVMFDAHKLDISDELKSVMQLMIPHLDKIRIVLNKADTVSTQQLLRVYGALMWSLGKVMNTPEVSRVYVGSFWDNPLQNVEQIELLQREEIDLLNDIMSLPQHAIMRRINELVKRARSVKVHAYIIHYLRKQLPYNPWQRREKQLKLVRRLDNEFLAAARRYSLPKGDFPTVESMRPALIEIKDLGEFPKLDKKLIRDMDKVFSIDIPELLERAKSQ